MGLLFAAVREARNRMPNSGLRPIANVTPASNSTSTDFGSVAETNAQFFPQRDSQKEGRFPPREVPSNPVAQRVAERRVQGPLKAESGNLPVSFAVGSETNRHMHSVGSSTQESDKRLQLAEVPASLDSFSHSVSSAYYRGESSMPVSASVDVPSDRDVNSLVRQPVEKPLGRLPGSGTPSDLLLASDIIEATSSPRSPPSGSKTASRNSENGLPEISVFQTDSTKDSASMDPKAGNTLVDPSPSAAPTTAASILEPAKSFPMHSVNTVTIQSVQVPARASSPLPIPTSSSPSPISQLEVLENRLQTLSGRIEAQAEALSRIPRGTPFGPTVRIGQVDVFITAPAPAPSAPAAQSDRGFFSRNYLRRV